MARWIFLRICAFWDTKRFIFESVAELLHNNGENCINFAVIEPAVCHNQKYQNAENESLLDSLCKS